MRGVSRTAAALLPDRHPMSTVAAVSTSTFCQLRPLQRQGGIDW